MADQEDQFDVFLSHASEDTAWCEQLAERLGNENVRVWFDAVQLKPGDHLAGRRAPRPENHTWLPAQARCTALLR